jgi:hypothetical protein
MIARQGLSRIKHHVNRSQEDGLATRPIAPRSKVYCFDNVTGILGMSGPPITIPASRSVA